ncbi:hypothetical protein DSO57_1021163 [Entomophthora muscae]|uniref:Uncharacterized protein n=1 Tax=Entomophthora muscae TaxID=34485 RepID=A0ACC2TRI5_9FUNG|nr:hypothetical protein DSO57_1021163 [Entomophthora muscae]
MVSEASVVVNHQLPMDLGGYSPPHEDLFILSRYFCHSNDINLYSPNLVPNNHPGESFPLSLSPSEEEEVSVPQDFSEPPMHAPKHTPWLLMDWS